MVDPTQHYLVIEPTGSSSYFDFVERKIDRKTHARQSGSRELLGTSKDSFVVKVMDREASEKLKRQYFNRRRS